MVEILFVHGALVRDGAWWWQPVADAVEATTGVRSIAVELPSCGEGTAHPGAAGLTEDAAALRQAIDRADGDVVVVGHSYGGTVIAEGADHPAVSHLVYISSYLPDIGQSQGELLASEPNPVSVGPASDSTIEVQGYDLQSFSDRFLHDVANSAVRADAWARVTAQSLSAFATPTTTAAWQGRESTYLVCAQDRSTTPELQRRHAARATRSIELPTGHHPFLSRPELVAEPLRAVL